MLYVLVTLMMRVLGCVTTWKRILKAIQYEPLKEWYESSIFNYTKVQRYTIAAGNYQTTDIENPKKKKKIIIIIIRINKINRRYLMRSLPIQRQFDIKSQITKNKS
ncbi:hypothetical protein BDV36DRAFT_125162 [Aspergillus pseudocaelatus]|uniref:Uncharacterized protein n=1 Tax=Aspergillus pseudocaelatus TaxID=1825620 RepID=A0ABQ6WS62_9EURO|nr:hypothetical protein BDV36DRAFT_125162 [Aspergillus pseudocaelatus]